MRIPRLWILGAMSVALLPVSVTGGERWASWEAAIASHELNRLDGETAQIGEMQGDVVVLNFWASWCKPCKKELLVLDELAASLEGSRARILAVSIDQEAKNASRYIEKAGLELEVFHDGTNGLASALDLPSLPCTIVVGTDGRIVEVAQDGSLKTLRRLERKVRELAPADETANRSASPEEQG